MVVKTYIQKVGRHRGQGRIWLESKKLEAAGFEPGMPIRLDAAERRIVIEPSLLGERIVQRRRTRPVLDLNNRLISRLFKEGERIVVRIYSERIVIEPLKVDEERKRGESKRHATRPRFLEIFAGGGTLTKAFADAGFIPVGAVELEDAYLENLEANFPDTETFCGPIEAFDPAELPDAEVVVGGIPCEAYSVAGVAKRNSLGEASYEAHTTGSLAYFFLKVVEAIRPAAVVVEEVPGFANSGAAAMVRGVLRSLGFILSENILDAKVYGSLTKRRRYCLVATMDEGFNFPGPSGRGDRRVADVLEEQEEREWLDRSDPSIARMVRREYVHRKKGDGFRMGAVIPSSDTCPTISKGYAKRRLSDPILSDGAERFSFFTPRELARLNGLPDDFVLPPVKTRACEIIGQGVAYEPFRAVADKLFQWFGSDVARSA